MAATNFLRERPDVPAWASKIALGLLLAISSFYFKEMRDEFRQSQALLHKIDRDSAVVQNEVDSLRLRADWAQEQIFRLWEARRSGIPMPEEPEKRGDVHPVIVPEKRRMVA